MPDTVTAVVPVSAKPPRIAGTTVPSAPMFVEIDVSFGVDGATTVNVTELLVPAGEVTVTFLAPRGAGAAMIKVAVTVVSLTTMMLLAVTPVPEMLIPDAVVKPVPVNVTGTA